MQNQNNYPLEVQSIEQRSISFSQIKDHKHPGVTSLPKVNIDRSLFTKTKEEKNELNRLKKGVVNLGFYCSNSIN